MQILLSNQQRFDEQLHAMKASLDQAALTRHLEMQRELATIHCSIKRIAMYPAQCVICNTIDAIVAPSNTVLTSRPKTFTELWNEYKFGLENNKPAKSFTASERGKVRFKYCRRKVFWDKVSELVCAGHIAEVASDKVYQAYGQSLSVSTILAKMADDKRKNTVPLQLQL